MGMILTSINLTDSVTQLSLANTHPNFSDKLARSSNVFLGLWIESFNKKSRGNNTRWVGHGHGGEVLWKYLPNLNSASLGRYHPGSHKDWFMFFLKYVLQNQYIYITVIPGWFYNLDNFFPTTSDSHSFKTHLLILHESAKSTEKVRQNSLKGPIGWVINDSWDPCMVFTIIDLHLP